MLLHPIKKGLRLGGAVSVVFALCCMFVFASRAAERNSFSREQVASAKLANRDFAIADFDGDQVPDFATVEVDIGSRDDTQYSIRFNLTSGGKQAFGVVAPAGGLQIVAQDVNGDNVLDVLVTTAWQHLQIAVFLNDGHGNFTPADPREFPSSIWGSDRQWNAATAASYDIATLVRTQGFSGALEEQRHSERPREKIGRAQAIELQNPSSVQDLSALGRAPPR